MTKMPMYGRGFAPINKAKKAIADLKAAMKPICREHRFLSVQLDRAIDQDAPNSAVSKIERQMKPLEKLMDQLVEIGSGYESFGVYNPGVSQ